MSEQQHHFRLGLFVVIGFFVLAALVVVLGGGKWLRTSMPLETYFDESVNGIDIGSKIRYRGVVVGEVSDISFSSQHYESDKSLDARKQYVMVTAKLQPNFFGRTSGFPEQADLDKEIARGLRIRMVPQGLTGTNYLEADYVSGATAVLPIDWTPDNLYIPSAKSTVNQFVSGAQGLMDKLQKINLEQTVFSLNKLLITLNHKVDSIPLAEIGKNTEKMTSELARVPYAKLGQDLGLLVTELRDSNHKLNALLSDPALTSLPKDLSASAQQARKILEDPALAQTLQNLNQLTTRLDRLLASRDEDIATLIDDLKETSAKLRQLSSNAERYPTAILFGQPPKPYEPPR